MNTTYAIDFVVEGTICQKTAAWPSVPACGDVVRLALTPARDFMVFGRRWRGPTAVELFGSLHDPAGT
ncbi:MAG TPA: hypothetical protein VFC47_11450 [Caulobacteraceae bacterium]|nr:hypothetical protein [Caulobacteraceae bacterium]